MIGREFVCSVHRDRLAATGVPGAYKCWECWLGREKFVARFGAGFYDSADSPGRASGEPRRKKEKVKRKKGKRLPTDSTDFTEKGLF